MMNTLGKELIAGLRDGSIAFDMRGWAREAHYFEHTANACGTVGCIAGSALLLRNRLTIPRGGILLDGEPAVSREIIRAAASELELNFRTAYHLFMPDDWSYCLMRGSFEERYREVWKDNYRCDLDTIEKMKEFAKHYQFTDAEGFSESVLMDYIQAPQAAQALEDVYEKHPHYTDWCEAFGVAV